MASFSFDRVNNVVTVLAPDTEVTVQELYNACRDYEDENRNLDIPALVSGAGKQELGGGVKVGITITLIDWKMTFEARAGPTWVLCEISGGNLVGYDTGLESFYTPIEPSAYTTIVRTASSSATIQEQTNIQHAVFNGGVTIDVINGGSGTAFPWGTPFQPVDNLADASAIASSRGFNTLYIIGNLTIANGDDVDGFKICGQAPIFSVITIEAGASTADTIFVEATVTGTLAGNASVRDCYIQGLTYIEGKITDCILTGTITLAGTSTVNLINCADGMPGDTKPTINCGGSGRNLTMNGYSGDVLLTNKTGSESISVDLIAGSVEIDTTVTAGDIFVRGVGTVEDNSTGTAVVDTTAMINQQLIVDGVFDENIASHLTDGSFGASIMQLLGLGGENVQWSALSFDANSNLTGATITVYTDKTLTTPRKAWIVAATYNAQNELTAYSMAEV